MSNMSSHVRTPKSRRKITLTCTISPKAYEFLEFLVKHGLASNKNEAVEKSIITLALTYDTILRIYEKASERVKKSKH